MKKIGEDTMGMQVVRVIISYFDKLNSITVDGMEMDISAIQDRTIESWFTPSNGRDGWKGLKWEIREMLGDDEFPLSIEFVGPVEYKSIFEKCKLKYGLENIENTITLKDIIEDRYEEAEKAEHRGWDEKAFQNYKFVADSETIEMTKEAQFKVANYYLSAYRGEKNVVNVDDGDREKLIVEAVNYFEKAAKQGYKEAQFSLYKLLAVGEGINADQEEANRWLFKSATSGYADAQFELGERKRAEKNLEEAVSWYRKAAEQGEVRAQYNLGLCYQCGIGVELNPEEGVSWYRKAAEQGEVRAQNDLGECYEKGYGVEENPEEAVSWFEKAAEQGEARTQNTLGECYEKGYGVEENPEEAVSWYRKAAEQGEARAQYNLGMCYEKGYGVEKNPEEAVSWYEKAAEQGEARAQNNLGECYEYGYGVEKNPEEAVSWYRKAAEQGEARAQISLGMCYQEGYGVEKNLEEAVSWYEKAAEQGETYAQCLLGLCYIAGYGIEKNLKEGMSWYRKAAEQGNAIAQTFLGSRYEKGIGVEKNLEEAVKWYKIAGGNGDGEAYYRLAEMMFADMTSVMGTTAALLLTAAVVPVTNLVTVPTAIVGSRLRKRMIIKKALKTDQGKEMLQYYEKAAELGYNDAKKKWSKLKKYL